MNKIAPPPTSLYIHMPWCEKKCPYCDFNSHHKPSILPEKAYIDRLIHDFETEWTTRGLENERLHSVFIGGGTPSLFSAESISRLMDNIRPCLYRDTEVTLEANPGSAEAEKFQAYREAGINRLSLGIQSFQDVFLKKIGRIHSAKEAERAIGCVINAGFERWNIDLMFGLPGQSLDAAMSDLYIAQTFRPPHLSWYQLTLEPQTAFHQQPPSDLPEPDNLADMHTMGMAFLEKNGFERYEISAFAHTQSKTKGRTHIDQRAQHNLHYWHFGDYIGIGAGAHGKQTRIENGAFVIQRTMKQKSPWRYQDPQWPMVSQSEIPDPEQIALEFLMNGLRMPNGVEASLWEKQTGLSLSFLSEKCDELQRQQLLKNFPDRLQCSERGLLFLNEILSAF